MMRAAARRFDRIVASLPLAAVVRAALADLVASTEGGARRDPLAARRESLSAEDRSVLAGVLEQAQMCMLTAMEARLRVAVRVAQVQGLNAEIAAHWEGYAAVHELGAVDRAAAFEARVAATEAKLEALGAVDPIATYRAYHRDLVTALKAAGLGVTDVPAPIAEPIALASAARELIQGTHAAA